MPKQLKTTDKRKTAKQKSVVKAQKADKLRTPPKYPPCPPDLRPLILNANLYLDWQQASEDVRARAKEIAVLSSARLYYPDAGGALLKIARKENIPIDKLKLTLF